MNNINHNRCVKLYDDINVYNKNQIYYACGNIVNLGEYKNRIGSVELPTRTCTNLYTDNNFNGNNKILCNYSYERNKIFTRLGNLDKKSNSMQIYELPDN